MGIVTVLLAVSPLESILDDLLSTMVAQSETFIAFGRAIGFIGALCYVFFRVWAHMSRNEPIDVFPLLRPVALAFCLVAYPELVSGLLLINKQLNDGTAVLVRSKQGEVDRLNQLKDQALESKSKQIILDLNKDGEVGWTDFFVGPQGAAGQIMSNVFQYGISKWMDEAVSWLGDILYRAAALVVKFLQTFFLLILVMTGPLTIGLACFDWFYSSLPTWTARFIHVMLWGPIVNILAGILEQIHITMLEIDIQQINQTAPEAFTSTNVGMICFYIMGIMGYIMVPKVSSWILESAGVGTAVASALSPGKTAASTTMMVGGAATGGVLGTGMGTAYGAAQGRNSV